MDGRMDESVDGSVGTINVPEINVSEEFNGGPDTKSIDKTIVAVAVSLLALDTLISSPVTISGFPL